MKVFVLNAASQKCDIQDIEIASPVGCEVLVDVERAPQLNGRES